MSCRAEVFARVIEDRFPRCVRAFPFHIGLSPALGGVFEDAEFGAGFVVWQMLVNQQQVVAEIIVFTEAGNRAVAGAAALVVDAGGGDEFERETGGLCPQRKIDIFPIQKKAIIETGECFEQLGAEKHGAAGDPGDFKRGGGCRWGGGVVMEGLTIGEVDAAAAEPYFAGAVEVVHDRGGDATVRIGLERRGEMGGGIGMDGGVVVEEIDERGLWIHGEDMLDAGVVAAGEAEIFVGLEDGDIGEGGADDGGGIVLGAVIDDDDVLWCVAVVLQRGEALERVGLAVVIDQDDRDGGVHG